MAQKNPNLVSGNSNSEISVSSSDYVVPQSTAAGYVYQPGYRNMDFTPSEISEMKNLPDVFASPALSARHSDTALVGRNLRTQTEIEELQKLPSIAAMNEAEQLKTAVEAHAAGAGASHSVYLGPQPTGISSGYVYEYKQ